LYSPLSFSTLFIFFHDTATTELYTLSLHDALPIFAAVVILTRVFPAFFEAYLLRAAASLQYFAEAPNAVLSGRLATWQTLLQFRAEEHTSELQSRGHLVCRLLLERKKKKKQIQYAK